MPYQAELGCKLVLEPIHRIGELLFQEPTELVNISGVNCHAATTPQAGSSPAWRMPPGEHWWSL